MNKQEKELLMERICVLVNGIAGAVVGFCTYVLILVLCMVRNWIPVNLFGFYGFFIGAPVIFVCIAFYLAVRKDWWVMKRRW